MTIFEFETKYKLLELIDKSKSKLIKIKNKLVIAEQTIKNEENVEQSYPVIPGLAFTSKRNPELLGNCNKELEQM